MKVLLQNLGSSHQSVLPVVVGIDNPTDVQVGVQSCKKTGNTPKSDWEVRRGCLDNQQESGGKGKVQGEALRGGDRLLGVKEHVKN